MVCVCESTYEPGVSLMTPLEPMACKSIEGLFRATPGCHGLLRPHFEVVFLRVLYWDSDPMIHGCLEVGQSTQHEQRSNSL